MTYKNISYGIIRAVIILCLIAGGIYLLIKIKIVIIFIFLAFILSLMGRPLMKLFNKLKINNSIASIFTILIMLSVFFGLIASMIPLFIQQANNLSLSDTVALEHNIREQFVYIKEYLKSKHLNIIDNDVNINFLPKFKLSAVSQTLQGYIGTFSSIFVAIFSVFFITFFFLKDKELFNRMILSAVPRKDEIRTEVTLSEVKDLLTRYFLGLFFQVMAMFILYYIILLSFGIENALLIAFFCAFLDLIPYLGPLLAFFIFIILSMSSMIGMHMNLHSQIIPNLTWIGSLYLVAQSIDVILIQPIIYSKSVKSHPLEIFIVMLISGTLFGLIGVVFAIPMYTVLRVIAKNFYPNFKIVQEITKNI